jgi:GxxExxY protein
MESAIFACLDRRCAKRTRRQNIMSDDLTEKILGAAIEVHRLLGPGLLESIYEEALCVEFELRGIPFVRQAEVEVVYKGRSIKGQRIDLLVAGEVVVELKSVATLPEVAKAQVLSYLKATGLKRGLLINFGCNRLVDGVKRLSM